MDSRPLKVASIQFKPRHKDVVGNLNNLFKLCHQATTAGAQLLVLPEMCLTGYIWESPKLIAPFAEASIGESFQKMATFCKEYGCYIAYGFAEKDEELLFNSQNLVSPDGTLLGTYRKENLFAVDTLWASPGNLGYISLECSLGKVGLGICMDLNFDDFVQFHIENKTRLLLLAVNWLDEGHCVLDYWKERLRNFRGTAIISNTYGMEKKVLFCGLSAVFHRDRFQGHAPIKGDFVLLFDIPENSPKNQCLDQK
ncbi:MAG: carbon-nitrogen hydrolase family protein [Proteobacteria bacterium]|nr:carbon-nitrogen hydrolase family protein [Pseudomonadota bacterium]